VVREERTSSPVDGNARKLGTSWLFQAHGRRQGFQASSLLYPSFVELRRDIKDKTMRSSESKLIEKNRGSHATPRRIVILGLWMAWVLSGGVAVSWGQSVAVEPAVSSSQEEDATEGSGKDEGSLASKVTIHGYLSQAYAVSDGNQIVGITKDGTADYRTAAVQVRADISDQDIFAVQFSHERNGVSPTQKILKDVEVDWIFYQHRFGSDSSVKIGRMPIPLGIYNEIRDVGTALPFYRPPRSFYGEGSLTTETVDGILLSHKLGFGDAWGLSGDVYYGNWDGHDVSQNVIKMMDTIGFQLFLDTPVSGLRLGVGGIQFESDPNPTLPSLDWQDFHGSVQASFGRVQGEIEYRHGFARPRTGKALYDVKVGYVRLGVALTEKLILQSEYDSLKFKTSALPGEIDYDDDKALGLVYRFRPDLVLKAEHHWNEGFFLEIPVNPLGTAPKTRFGILSLAVSF